ncbi:hypothetical protein QTP88_019490 [Uroleucon formosanum]
MTKKLNSTNHYANKCILESCGKKKTSNETISFFPFPEDPARCAIWLKNCKLSADILSIKNIKICGKHFESKMFLNNLKNKLQPHAIPKLLSGILHITVFTVPENLIKFTYQVLPLFILLCSYCVKNDIEDLFKQQFIINDIKYYLFLNPCTHVQG